jgi:pimeloyl-ACP methyl ester carboxylesterase
MLEVIDKGSSTECHPVPLLFVHGAWHGAWCWDEGFLDFLADKGFRVLALSLRGHGGSSAPRRLRFISFADYLQDVAAVAADLPTPPVLVGHSMGGYVVQKYLETNHAPAGVLVASVPQKGAVPLILRWIKLDPWPVVKALLTGRTLPYVGSSTARVREKFYSPQTLETDVRRYAALVQEESQRAILGLLPVTRPNRVRTPMLVLGATDDGCFTVKEAHATARAYGTEAEIFSDMGHNMMLEPGWQAVAERIVGWLTDRGL